ncbi:hypothetical protein DNTS_032241 [Danionella cerebrum]|uniref:Zinc finger CCHC domain-containing protein 8 n=1 Tax=Danionella cerebrum TaxID=2873325 RepID=A0A553NIS1_9TELE|nr:hypothetical protein DNTS_032241 [Danionella translucida]TRY65336.1 hypothetical protein DNTS_032241 [Danionella translucida]
MFEQFEDTAPIQSANRDDEDAGEQSESSGRLRQLQQTLEETIERLNAENILLHQRFARSPSREPHVELKRKLNVLSRPTGIKVPDSKTDGPLCQINYGNNLISKQCRSQIEDFIVSVVQKHLHHNEADDSSPNLIPHPSSFVMEESYKVRASGGSKHVKKAFSIIGSVLYFTDFCVDKLGQPLLNDNPQLSDGWEVPKYQQLFGHIVALEGQEVQMKEKRPRPCCFNCCSEAHQLRDCPEPKDMARINAKRKEFAQVNNQSNQRYHADEVDERFAKYKPGVLSQDLLDALGISTNTLPPFIYRMRELGYPPGWLKEAELENSGLMLYDGSKDGDENSPSLRISYDVSKLVEFPGFNVSTPPNIRDEFRTFGSIPMQPQHWKDNFAAFLSSKFPTGGSCSKRPHESEATPQKSKKRRSSSEHAHHICDMEIESGKTLMILQYLLYQDTAQTRAGGFQFHPPLPPGSCPATPPPLPLGTPPSTPPIPKGTPPETPPSKDFAPNRLRGVTEGEESEDGLTLEELEEQQKLLWAALEKADTTTTTTNSDSDTGASASQTPVPSSPSVVTSLKLDSDEDEEKTEDSSHLFEVKSTPTSPAEPAGDEMVLPIEISDVIVLDEIAEENGHHQAPGETSATRQQKPSAEGAEDVEEPVINKVSFVPHRSRFAAGIIPFEDTPEFTEVAEATGVYLKIRDLLKGSPRNQAKRKK